MAISSLPPWLQTSPEDFLKATSAGAAAGLEAQRTAAGGASAGIDVARMGAAGGQAGLEAVRTAQGGAEVGLRSRQLALEAQQQIIQAQQAANTLASHERIANMEAQARKEITEQNRLREDQQNAISNAMRSMQIGIAKQKVADDEAIANQKAIDAALTYKDEVGLADYIRGGGDPATGLLTYRRAAKLADAYANLKSGMPGGPEAIDIPGSGGRQAVKLGNRYQLLPELTQESKVDDELLKARIKRRLDLGITDEAAQKELDDLVAQRKALASRQTPPPSPEAPLGWRHTPDGKSWEPVPYWDQAPTALIKRGRIYMGPAGGELAPGQPERVTTQAQYDALPSGTIYVGEDGKKYRKP